MPATLEHLTAEALTLPETSRAQLAQRLLESLPPPGNVELGEGYFLTTEQVAEIRRRATASEPDKLVPAEEFFARLNRTDG